jgi:hypothetical protein
MLTPLCQLARKYGSDKYSAKHSYTPWYWEQFKDRRNSVRKVVEIGVGEGASLRMWREFFPNAWVYGMDIDSARCFYDDRITVWEGDQASAYDLAGLAQNVGPDVDLFIDDGSHKPEQQRFTCEYVMPQLHPGVTYVIEDVIDDTPWATLVPYSVEVPKLERRRRHDNRLVVVRHHA